MTDAEKQAWRDFVNSTPDYLPSTPNNGLVVRYLHAAGRPTTVQTLTRAYQELRDALEVKVREPTPPVAQPIAESYDETAEPGYPIRGGLEDGWSYQNRLIAWREARAQKAWRDSENARMLAQPPAESTLRRTRAEQKLVAEEQRRFRERQNSETKF